MKAGTVQKLLACLFLTVFALAPLPSCLAREDTAHLVFRKTVVHGDRSPVYVVRKGDHLMEILRREAGAGPQDMAWMLREVRRLNPGMKDPNVIEPGQKIALPLGKAPEGYQAYRVKKGDNLTRILQTQLGLKGRDLHRALAGVKRQNPGIRNLNRILPGQRIFIPALLPTAGDGAEEAKKTAPEKAAAEPEGRSLSLSDRELQLITLLVERAGGAVLTDGNYYIPLSAEEQLTVECSTVPVVELDDGSKIILDFKGNVPRELKDRLEATWKNYTVLKDRGEGDALAVVARIFSRSKSYAFRNVGSDVDIGTGPTLRVFLGWALYKEDRMFTGLVPVETRSQRLPAPVAQFAERNGLTLLSVGSDLDVWAGETDAAAPQDVPALGSSTSGELVDALLAALGYSAVKGSWVKIFDSSQDGRHVSLKADYFVEKGGRSTVINLREMPDNFREALKERGISVAVIGEQDDRKAVVEKTLAALGIPFKSERHGFRGPGKDGRPLWLLEIEATKAETEQGPFYLTPQAIDRDLYGYLKKAWQTNLIRY